MAAHSTPTLQNHFAAHVENQKDDRLAGRRLTDSGI
jgi:hypothetical protein